MESMERPTETKLYCGIQYSVNVPVGESTFMVSIGDGINSIEESITCNDVSADDYRELFKRGREYAEKSLMSRARKSCLAPANKLTV